MLAIPHRSKFYVVPASGAYRCRLARNGDGEMPFGTAGRMPLQCPLRTPSYTLPFFNSSSEYFVPRHTIPLSHSVRNIERSMV